MGNFRAKIKKRRNCGFCSRRMHGAITALSPRMQNAFTAHTFFRGKSVNALIITELQGIFLYSGASNMAIAACFGQICTEIVLTKNAINFAEFGGKMSLEMEQFQVTS